VQSARGDHRSQHQHPSGSTTDECAAGKTGLDTITFDPSDFNTNQTISISSGNGSLPSITAPVNITNNNAGHTVFLYGWGGISGVGFTFTTGSAGSTLNNIDIGNWGGYGVWLTGTSGKVTLTNNWIGFYPNGIPDANYYGLVIDSSNNVIGGLDPAGQRRTNVISGNLNQGILVNGGTANIIQGNYIGTKPDGLTPLANGSGNYAGVEVAGAAVNTLVGGMKAGQGNVISGNSAEGLQIDNGARTTKVQRNFFGVGADGNTALSNNNVNITDLGGLGTVIGGTMPQASNVIANTAYGIYLNGSTGTITITGNIIGLNADGGAAGGTDGILFVDTPIKTTITGNLISQNTYGINFGTYTPITTITQNCITGNTSYGVITTGSTELVAFNWWGVSSGPNTSGGDATSGSLTTVPFLTKAPSSCLGWAPKTIMPGVFSFSNKRTTPTTFKWSKVLTASSYDYNLYQETPSYSVIDFGNTTLTKYTTPASLDYGTYDIEFNVHTADAVVWATSPHYFYVTTMTSPKPGATVVLNSAGVMTFRWLAYSGATGYTISLYNDLVCSALNSSLSLGNVTQVTTLPGGVTAGPHSWTIQPNSGPIMPCWSFNVQ
jgi:hypothetical protein